MSLLGVRMPSSGPGPRWLWALLLALWLPLAQGVAAAHAITHHGTAQRDAASSALDAHCGQCLIAASVSAGALPSAVPALVAPAAAHAPPRAAARAAAASALTLAYRSRAPPSFLH